MATLVNWKGLTPLHGYFPLSNPQDEVILADWPKFKTKIKMGGIPYGVNCVVITCKEDDHAQYLRLWIISNNIER